jgi:hypothetical protein
VQLLRLADPVAKAVALAADDDRDIFLRRRDELLRGKEGLAREMARAGAELAAAAAMRPTRLGGGWPVDLSMFVGAEASGSADQWIRPRPTPGQRLWRLKRLGANVTHGAQKPRPLPARLLLRLLAAPFVAAWYVIALGLVAFFMFVSVFIGVTVFAMVYGCAVSLITVIPMLIELILRLVQEH